MAKLLSLLIANPVLSVVSAQELLHVSNEAARLALVRLNEIGILQEKMGNGYARVWAAPQVFSLLEDFDFGIDGAGWPGK